MRWALLAAAALAGCVHGDEPERRVVVGEGWIAFSSSRDGDYDVYLMRPDGTSVRNLTRNSGRGFHEFDDGEPAWSPDGRRIAFTSTRDHRGDGVSKQEIYVMDADGRDQRRLTSNRLAEFAPDWLPDGRIVFVQCANEIIRCAFVAVEVASGAEEVLHRTDGALFGLSVSPSGDELAYTRWEPESERLNGDVYVVDLGTGDERRVTDSAANDGDGDWSPDGERLVFATDRDGKGRCLFHDCVGSKPELYVVDSDGSDPRRLTSTDLQETHPVWSPDGTRILFARIRDDNDDYELFVADADGANAEQLTDNAEWDWQPDWWAPTRVGD